MTTSRIALIILLSLPVAQAQALPGKTLGTVTDASGAIVAGATVRVHCQGTNLEVRTESQTSGLYQISNLPLGMYTVTFAKAGFQAELHSQIVVQAERATTVNGKSAGRLHHPDGGSDGDSTGERNRHDEWICAG